MVGDDQTIRFGSVRYSTPDGHQGGEVWCRVVGDELVIVGRSSKGLVEIVRHVLSTPGHPQILDEHYPHPAGNGPRPPKARPKSEAEVAFCAIGEGATRWLVEAAAVGTARIRTKMAEAVELAALVGGARVEEDRGSVTVPGVTTSAFPRFVHGRSVSPTWRWRSQPRVDDASLKRPGPATCRSASRLGDGPVTQPSAWCLQRRRSVITTELAPAPPTTIRLDPRLSRPVPPMGQRRRRSESSRVRHESVTPVPST